MRHSLFLLFLLAGSLFGESPGISIDLMDPTFKEGILTTTKGGVLQTDQIRIQAMSIYFVNKKEERFARAKGCLMVEFGPYLFVGDELEYDFLAKKGVLSYGKSAVPPWGFGGEEVIFHPNGEVTLKNGYITSNDRPKTEWRLALSEACLYENRDITASNLQLQLFNFPIFWLPYLRSNLDWMKRSPLRFRLRWGGQDQVRLGIIYQFLSLPNFNSSVRFDYRANRGPGGGLETHWKRSNGCGDFHTINYLARDSSLENLLQRTRYRFQGSYHDRFDCGRTTLKLSYDKLSDLDMPTDYHDKGLDLKTGMRTELKVRRQQYNLWLANFNTRVRINNFQTVNQRLPSLTLSTHPYTVGCTGIISEQTLRAGYLDFRYANDAGAVSNYSSMRMEAHHTMYRPFCFGPITFTPEIGGRAIFYEDSPTGSSEWLTFGTASADLSTQLWKQYGSVRHTLEPYLLYEHITTPSIPLSSHFIFDSEDAWQRLNTLRFGARNLLYRSCGCEYQRLLTMDTYAYAFFDSHTTFSSIPKLYTKILWDVTPRLREQVTAAWDFDRNHLDHINLRCDWTITEKLAIAAEYRHRDATAWRKVDPSNYLLESARSEALLTASTLSDRRDTVLAHLFYRLQPNLATEFEVRQGWNRITEPDYLEYQVSMHTRLSSLWDLRLSYQKKEDDHRFTFFLTLAKIPYNTCWPGL